jgi:hypothetical protein
MKRILAATLISMLLAPSVSLAFSTSATAGTAATGWTGSTNVFTSNDVRATSTISTGGGITPALTVSGFNFAVPANAIVKGFSVAVERSHNGNALTTMDDNNVQLMKALSAVGSNLASGTNWTTTDTVANYGSATNMWGTTWTPTDINSSGFGLSFAADCATCGLVSRDARIDYVTINAFYTLPQTIIPSVIPPKTYGDADFDPAFTGGASGNPVTYTSTTLPVCTVVANQIHIVAAGTCTFNANQAGTAGDYEAATQVTTNITIAPKAITVTGITGVDRLYDGTTSATLSVAGANIPDRAGADNASHVDVTAAGAVATFADKNIGAAKPVTITSIVLTGTKAASYTLPAANINGGLGTTASIAARPLTVTAQTDTKTYDGNTTSAVLPLVTSGVVQPGDLAAFTQAFDTEAVSLVAGDKILTATGVVTDGNSGNNYTYAFVTGTGTINKKTITEASFTNPDTEVYDPTNARAWDGTPTINNADVKITSTDVVSGDDVVFAPLSAAFVTPTVGTLKPVNIVINPVFTGADAGNYVLGPDGADGYSAVTTAGITDTTAPVVSITSGPADSSTQNTDAATVAFTVTEAATSVASVECRLDAGAYAPCTSPVSLTGLSEGVHNFYVRATDTSTNPGANTSVPVAPDSRRTFTVDLTAPTVSTVTSSAPNPTNTSPIPFTVIFSEDVTGVDVADFVATNGTVSGVTQNTPSNYTVDVTPDPLLSGNLVVTLGIAAAPAVTDIAGNALPPSALTFNRTYDSVAPTITQTAGPAHLGFVNTTTVVFSFTAPGATFECNPDGAGYGPCTDSAGSHTMSGLGAGMHTFDVKATDAATNFAVLSRTFTVDLTAPTVTLNTPVLAPTYVNTNPITVTATFNEPVTGVDIADFVVTNGTTSNFVAVNPTTYTVDITPTADGAITIDLPASAAQDLATNQNTAAMQIIVNYDGTAPTLTFSVEPPALTNDNTLDFTFVDADATSGVSSCKISVDGGPSVACASPFATPVLGDGPHTVTFSVIDNATNALVVVKNVTVDTTAPLLVQVTPVPTPTFTNEARPYTYESSEAGTAVLGGGCTGSGSALFGMNTIGMGALTSGTYNCTIVVTDAAGNPSLPLAMSTFEVKDIPGNGPVTSGGASFPIAGAIQQGGSNGPTQGTTGIAVNIPTPSSPQGGDSSTGGSGVGVTTTGNLAANPVPTGAPENPQTPTVAVTNTSTGEGQAAGGTTVQTPTPKQQPKSLSKSAPKGSVTQKGKPTPVAKTKAPTEKSPAVTVQTQTASAGEASQGFWAWIKGLIFGN